MTVHCAKGEGEIKDLNKIKEYSGYKMWVNSDLTRDVAKQKISNKSHPRIQRSCICMEIEERE